MDAEVLTNTWNYRRGIWPQGGDVLIEPEDLRAALEGLGFSDIALGPEASLGEPSIAVSPFFQGEYLGDLGVYEVLARR